MSYDYATSLLTKEGINYSIHKLIKMDNGDGEILSLDVYCSPIMMYEKKQEIEKLLGKDFLVWEDPNRQLLKIELR